MWRHYRVVTQIAGQPLRLIAFVGSVHSDVPWLRGGSEHPQEFPALWRVPGVAGREAEYQRAFSSRGNHMNLCCPAASGFPNGLSSCFFKAPVPSG